MPIISKKERLQCVSQPSEMKAQHSPGDAKQGVISGDISLALFHLQRGVVTALLRSVRCNVVSKRFSRSLCQMQRIRIRRWRRSGRETERMHLSQASFDVRHHQAEGESGLTWVRGARQEMSVQRIAHSTCSMYAVDNCMHSQSQQIQKRTWRTHNMKL